MTHWGTSRHSPRGYTMWALKKRIKERDEIIEELEIELSHALKELDRFFKAVNKLNETLDDPPVDVVDDESQIEYYEEGSGIPDEYYEEGSGISDEYAGY